MTTNEKQIGKLDGRLRLSPVATAASALPQRSGFVNEGAYVFITGRRKSELDAAVKEMGKMLPRFKDTWRTSTTDGIAFSLNSKFTKTARDKGPHRRRSMKRQTGATRSTPAIQRALHYNCAP